MYSVAMDCNLKVALFSAQLEQYPRAIEIFESVRMCVCRPVFVYCLVAVSEGRRVRR